MSARLDGSTNEAYLLIVRFLQKYQAEGRGGHRECPAMFPGPRPSVGLRSGPGEIYVREPTSQQRAAAYQRVWRSGLHY